MKIRTLLVMGAVAVSALGFTPSHANTDESCSIAGGSLGTPHVIDPAGDSVITSGNPDVDSHDSTDLLSAWFARDDNGVVTANISVATLTGAETNQIFYMLWDFKGHDDAIKTTRFVSIQPRPSTPPGSPVAYGPRFRWGYLDSVTNPALPTYVAQGDSTGTVTPGSPGVMSIVLPLDKMGAPGPGDTLGKIQLRSSVLAGSPGLYPIVTLPTLPASVPGGLVFTVDDATNALDYCADITV